MTILLNLMQKLIALMLSIFNLLGLSADTVSIELYANPNSGYSWEYEMDESGVLIMSESYYTPDSSAILSGGGGTQKYTFRAVSSGTVNITFRYVKNNDRDVASTYVYTYEVDDNGNINHISTK